MGKLVVFGVPKINSEELVVIEGEDMEFENLEDVGIGLYNQVLKDGKMQEDSLWEVLL